MCTIHGTHKHLFFNKTFIKNGSHDTIHIFKNYFATIFSVFGKINGIQIYHKHDKDILLKKKKKKDKT